MSKTVLTFVGGIAAGVAAIRVLQVSFQRGRDKQLRQQAINARIRRDRGPNWRERTAR